MWKTYCSILVLGLCLQLGFAQNYETYLPEDYRLQLKFNPLALISLQYPGIHFGSEHRLTKKSTFITEVGAMRRFASPFSTWPANLWGYRLRSGWRYYTKGHHQNRTDFYLSSWLQVKQLYVSENDFVERFGGAFRERMDLRETRNYLGAFFALGWQGAISPNSRWELDFGMGVRYRWVSRNILPADVIDPRTDTRNTAFGPLEQNLFWPDWMPIFTLDFRFNFLIPRKKSSPVR
ncbi:MAG: hypothetical protein AAFW73_24755 [Bacteroidota bacterium]